MGDKKNYNKAIFINILIFIITFFLSLVIIFTLSFCAFLFLPIEDIFHGDLMIPILLIVLLCLLVAFLFYRKSMIPSAIGIAVIPLIIGLLFCYSIISSIQPVKSVEFNQLIWNSSEEKPYEMAASLIQKKDLIGKSKVEIVKLLGKDYKESNFKQDTTIVKYTLINNMKFDIIFRKDSVIKSVIREERLLEDVRLFESWIELRKKD